MIAVATAVTFTWLGLVLGISFLEAPLKFCALASIGVDLRVGLGIGRLVFRALNAVEAGLAVLLLALVGFGDADRAPLVAAGAVAAVLALQLLVVRPRLTRRSDLVLAGRDAPRSHAHHAYIALETVKLVALIGTGFLLQNS